MFRPWLCYKQLTKLRHFSLSLTDCSDSCDIIFKRSKFSMSTKKRPLITLSVDGNISSGKSTLVSKLANYLPNDSDYQVEVVPEPLEKWCDADGHNMLDLFYQNPKDNCFMFQHYVQLTRLIDTVNVTSTKAENGNNGKIRIMERSLQNNRYCFVELAKRQESIDPAQYAVLTEWYAWLEKNMDLKLDLIIYLKTSPEVVFKRMKNRGRAEEAIVPLEYLKSLHETYEDWLVHKQFPENKKTVGGDKSQHIIVIDANRNQEEVAAQCIESVQKFLGNLANHCQDEVVKGKEDHSSNPDRTIKRRCLSVDISHSPNK